MKLGRVRIHPSFALLIALFIAIDSSAYALLVIAAAALHEAGHLRAMSLCRVAVQEIHLRAFGLEIVADGLRHLSYRDEAAIAFSGPMANLLAAVLTVGIVLMTGSFDGALFFVTVNLALAAINLMPVQGLDGGRILSALLLQRVDLEVGERVCRTVGIAALIAVLCGGVWLLTVTQYNFSLALIGCYLLARTVLDARNGSQHKMTQLSES